MANKNNNTGKMKVTPFSSCGGDLGSKKIYLEFLY